MMSLAKKQQKQEIDLSKAYEADPARFARVAASNPELEIALKVIAEQRSRIEELESETQTDSMTGVMNKRGIMGALQREVSRTNRRKNVTALLVMFDLDNLKSINDRYGHLAGDTYITGFADHLQQCVRMTDYVGRLGGDEFALLMTDGDPELMQLRVETIVAALNSVTVGHGDNRFPLEVSHGTVLIAPGASAMNCIEMADTQLYRCKATRKKTS